jgi:hypothetical protein
MSNHVFIKLDIYSVEINCQDGDVPMQCQSRCSIFEGNLESYGENSTHL